MLSCVAIVNRYISDTNSCEYSVCVVECCCCCYCCVDGGDGCGDGGGDGDGL